MRKMILAFLLAGAAAHAQPTAFVNVNVLPMDDDTVLEKQTVVVVDGRIDSMGPVDKQPVPEGSVLVDGTDRFLMPGLAEMHAHIPPVGSSSLQRSLSLFALNGVTTVRGMLGHPSHLELRDSLEAGSTFGPRLFTSGPSLNGSSVNGAADAARKVSEQKAAGYDFVKLHPGLSLAEFEAIAKAAKRAGIPFAGHVPVAVGVSRALESGMATIDHLDGYFVAMLQPDQSATGGFGGFFDVLLSEFVDDSRIEPMAVATKRAGTWNVPTQTLFENIVSSESAESLASRSEMRYMPPATVDAWSTAKQDVAKEGIAAAVLDRAIELRRRLIKALHDAGAGLLLGSDAPQIFNVPGFSIHRELQLLVDSGLSPHAALTAGTRSAAEFLQADFGVIAPGRRADLLLLDDNPLADISNSRRIHGVMLNGRWISAAEREQGLRDLRFGD